MTGNAEAPDDVVVTPQQLEQDVRRFIAQSAAQYKAKDGTVLPPYSYEAMVRHYITFDHPKAFFPAPPPPPPPAPLPPPPRGAR